METNIFHVFSKSIAKYIIFRNRHDYLRMEKALRYYQRDRKEPKIKLSDFLRGNKNAWQTKTFDAVWTNKGNNKFVDIIAYSLMPTHIHLVLAELVKNGIVEFIRPILNSYTRYFNTKHDRKGPLWQGHIKKVIVESDEQLLHLVRYVHLNPVTSYLVNKPEDWLACSYNESISPKTLQKPLCSFDEYLDISSNEYRAFVEEGIQAQRDLALIRKHLLE